MAIRDIGFLILLLIMAVYIWARNLYVIISLGNTLPIILSMPLFILMGSHWRMRTDHTHLSYSNLIIGFAGFAIGLLLDVVTMLAACWTYLLWTWISARADEQDLPSLGRLMVLPFLAFPWLNLEGNIIGWYFRLSGSWIAATIFSAMGFKVMHEGTQLIVQGLRVGIGEACSGINVLQSMLIAGSALNYLYLGKYKAYWWNLLILIAIAWLANTLRILVLCITALTKGQDFAMGIFHTWGGWLVVFIMMCLSWSFLSLQATYLKRSALPRSL